MQASWLSALAIIFLTVIATELIAFAVHKYVMHGLGWGWHRSHHEPGTGWFEKNDLYAILFGGLSLLFFSVAAAAWPPLWWVGAGMAIYGLLYTFVHDGLVHRRFPFVGTPRGGYLKRLVQAHRLHHAVKDRTGAVSFGFLYAPPIRKLKRELQQAQERE